MRTHLELKLMSRLLLIKTLLFSILLTSSPSSWSKSPPHESIFGRYLGTLKHKTRNMTQIAKLDLISYRNEVNKLKIIGILTIIFGGLDSQEYISYHFDDVGYNLLLGQFIFNQKDQDIRLKLTLSQDGILSGFMQSSNSGHVGDIVLSKNQKITENLELLSNLEGFYSGSCQNRPTFLALQSYRSTTDTIRIANPFGAYRIKGQWAVKDTRLCTSSKPCVTNQINDGTYDFYRGNLILMGSKKTINCKINENNIIECENNCTLKRQPSSFIKTIWPETDPFISEKETSIQKTPKNNASSWKPRADSFKEGKYVGYLFHERRKVYQRVSLDILNFKRDNGLELNISAVANLFFGPFDTYRVLTYRFKDQKFNLLAKNILFRRPEEDVDAILKIVDIGDEWFKGIWYSIRYGRVGVFFVTKDPDLPIPTDYPIIDNMGVEYDSEKLFLDLDIGLARTPFLTENPFYPLFFSGYFTFKKNFASRLMITGGSYDFYTGKIGLELNDGMRVVTGKVLENNEGIQLKWMSNGFGTVMQDYSDTTFQLRLH